MEQDEIYLVDVWRMLLREWKWFVATLAVTLACTYAFAHLVKRQWEATAWIQIGQVGYTLQGQEPKVEPLMRVLERLQVVPFENEILKSAGYSPGSPTAKLYRKSLKLDPMPYAGPLIRLKVRGFSRGEASQLATATVARLHAVHQDLLQMPLKSARARLGQVEADLQRAETELAGYQQAASLPTNGNEGNQSLANPVLASMLLSRKNEEIRGLQQAQSDLIERLGPGYTYGTSMIWPVYVPDRQAFPNPALTYGLGLLLALALGASAATARNALRRSASG